MIVIYLRFNYRKGNEIGERYAFKDIKKLNSESLVDLVEEIKEKKGYENLFIEDIKVLGAKR